MLIWHRSVIVARVGLWRSKWSACTSGTASLWWRSWRPTRSGSRTTYWCSRTSWTCARSECACSRETSTPTPIGSSCTRPLRLSVCTRTLQLLFLSFLLWILSTRLVSCIAMCCDCAVSSRRLPVQTRPGRVHAVWAYLRGARRVHLAVGPSPDGPSARVLLLRGLHTEVPELQRLHPAAYAHYYLYNHTLISTEQASNTQLHLIQFNRWINTIRF